MVSGDGISLLWSFVFCGVVSRWVFFLGFLLLVIMTVVSLNIFFLSFLFDIYCLYRLFFFILSIHLCCPVFLSSVFGLYLPSVTSEANLLVVIFLYLSTALKLLCSGTCQIDVINSGVAFLFSFQDHFFPFLFTCSPFFFCLGRIFFSLNSLFLNLLPVPRLLPPLLPPPYLFPPLPLTPHSPPHPHSPTPPLPSRPLLPPYLHPPPPLLHLRALPSYLPFLLPSLPSHPKGQGGTCVASRACVGAEGAACVGYA